MPVRPRWSRVIALGIDPGARWTALVVIDDDRRGVPALLEAITVDRGERQGDDLLDLPAAYVDAVLTQTAALLAELDDELDVAGVEWIRRPSWRVKGREKPLDPSAIIATGIVLGLVVGEIRARTLASPCSTPVALERVRPMGNGRLLPLTAYPAPLGVAGKGTDKRRHERSAYDVAMMAAQQHLNRTGRIHP